MVVNESTYAMLLEPIDKDFMYGRAFRDLDGHVWEAMWMDPAAVPDNSGAG